MVALLAILDVYCCLESQLRQANRIGKLGCGWRSLGACCCPQSCNCAALSFMLRLEQLNEQHAKQTCLISSLPGATLCQEGVAKPAGCCRMLGLAAKARTQAAVTKHASQQSMLLLDFMHTMSPPSSQDTRSLYCAACGFLNTDLAEVSGYKLLVVCRMWLLGYCGEVDTVRSRFQCAGHHRLHTPPE